MPKTFKLLVVASLVALASPAGANGASRSCASVIASHDGGGMVAFIIRTWGAAWWVQHFAGARPCG